MKSKFLELVSFFGGVHCNVVDSIILLNEHIIQMSRRERRILTKFILNVHLTVYW